jgi:HlyD family secretion protein
MHRPPLIVRVLVLLVVVAVVGVGAWYYLGQQASAEGALTASGTIEADTVTLAAQAPGRVLQVNADEGQAVTAGQPIIVLDDSTLAAQRAQAQAQLDAANANVAAIQQNAASLEQNAQAAEAIAAAADANLALLQAGPTQQQLAVAQAQVDAAQVAVDDLESAYSDLSSAARDTPAGQQLKLQRDTARAGLQTALAQQAQVAAGSRPEQIQAAQAQADAAHAQAAGARAQADALDGQVAAAQAQAAAAQAALQVLDSQIAQLTVSSPVDGVVLARSIEPGEYAAPGGALMIIGQLDQLTITVYVPEDRLGEVSLDQQAQVTVDSYAGRTFTGSVSNIADQAEFTPRNVQTVEGRKSTVFAVKLSIANPDGALKPGMPADVRF